MKNILIVGTGTIGEPLIGLLAQHKEKLGIDNISFFKRTPLENLSLDLGLASIIAIHMFFSHTQAQAKKTLLP